MCNYIVHRYANRDDNYFRNKKYCLPPISGYYYGNQVDDNDTTQKITSGLFCYAGSYVPQNNIKDGRELFEISIQKGTKVYMRNRSYINEDWYNEKLASRYSLNKINGLLVQFEDGWEKYIDVPSIKSSEFIEIAIELVFERSNQILNKDTFNQIKYLEVLEGLYEIILPQKALKNARLMDEEKCKYNIISKFFNVKKEKCTINEYSKNIEYKSP